MALARVQATPKATSQLAAAATFAATPAIGNAILVGVQISGVPTTSCADNRGNTYTLAQVFNAGISESAAIYYCPKITATGSPFTVTVSSPVNAAMVAVAVEVSGVGAGLTVERAIGGVGPTLLPPTLITPTNLCLLAVWAISATQASITVSTTDGLSPGWTQEVEELTYGPWQSGEIDSRVLTGATGNLQVQWSRSPVAASAAVLAAFKGPSSARPPRSLFATGGTTGPLSWIELMLKTDED